MRTAPKVVTSSITIEKVGSKGKKSLKEKIHNQIKNQYMAIKKMHDEMTAKAKRRQDKKIEQIKSYYDYKNFERNLLEKELEDEMLKEEDR
jgi:hypothetical protein